ATRSPPSSMPSSARCEASGRSRCRTPTDVARSRSRSGSLASSRPEPVRALVVGAGAVGRIFALHLQQGGAEVELLVKPHHLPDLEGDLVLHPLGRDPVRLRVEALRTEASELRARRYDHVWLCVSSPALRGDWLSELVTASGEATFVLLQPGLDDRALLLRHLPEERLVDGLLALVAWQAPLRGEAIDPPGVRYWLPPLSRLPFEGAR